MNKKKILTLALTLSMVAILAIGGTIAYFTDVTETKTNVFTVGGVNIELDEPEWEKVEDRVIMPGKVIPKDPTIKNIGDRECYAFLKMDMNKYVSLINLIGVHHYKTNKLGTYPGFIEFVTDLSENADLRAKVLDPWFQGINHEDWTVMNLEEIEAVVDGVSDRNNPSRLTVKLGYNGTLAPDDKATTDVDEAGVVTFMTSFTMPDTVTQSMLDGDDAYKLQNENGEWVSKSDFNTKNADFKMSFTAYAIQTAEIDTLEDAYAALNNLND